MAAAGGFPVGEPITDEDARIPAEEIVRRRVTTSISQGVDAHGHVCSGDPAQALLTVADDQGAEMIVVGNRGMSGAPARARLGSQQRLAQRHMRGADRSRRHSGDRSDAESIVD